MFLRAFSCYSFIKVSFDFLVIKHDSRDTDQHFRSEVLVGVTGIVLYYKEIKRDFDKGVA